MELVMAISLKLSLKLMFPLSSERRLSIQVAQDRQMSMLRMLRMHGEAVCNIGLYLSYALANLHKYLSLDRQAVYVTDATHARRSRL